MRSRAFFVSLCFLALVFSCGDDSVPNKPDIAHQGIDMMIEAAKPDSFVYQSKRVAIPSNSKQKIGLIKVSKSSSVWEEMSDGGWGKLRSIWGSSPSDIFAVGEGGLVLHYDGISWQQMFSVTSNHLYGVWGLGPSDVYAIGGYAILHYNGVQWGNTKLYYPACFSAIWGTCEDNLWMTSTEGYIWKKWHGDDWGLYIVCVVCPSFYAVHGVPSGEIFVAGEGGQVWQGDKKWFNLMLPTGTKATLRGIWGTAGNDLYVVGDEGTALHYDGKSWQRLVKSDSNFYGVWGSSSSDVYIVGHPVLKSDESVFHFDGKNWTKLPPPVPSNLNAIFGFSAKEVFVVGDRNILRRTP